MHTRQPRLSSFFEKTPSRDSACYYVPSTETTVIEQLYPLPWSFIIPLRYIQSCLKQHLQSKERLQRLLDTWPNINHQAQLRTLILRQKTYHDSIENIFQTLLADLALFSDVDSTNWFRKSTEKTLPHSQLISINSVIHSVMSFPRNGSASSFVTLTTGAFTAHGHGFKDVESKPINDTVDDDILLSSAITLKNDLSTHFEALSQSFRELEKKILQNSKSKYEQLQTQALEISFYVNNILAVASNILSCTALAIDQVGKEIDLQVVVDEIRSLRDTISSKQLTSFVSFFTMVSKPGSDDQASPSQLGDTHLNTLITSVSQLVTLTLSLLDQCIFFIYASSPQTTIWLKSIERKTLCFSQCLTVIISSVQAKITSVISCHQLSPKLFNYHTPLNILSDEGLKIASLNFELENLWSHCLRSGFLVYVESLLSSRGDERGMLQDMYQAIVHCRNMVKLGFHLSGDVVTFSGDQSNIVISIGLAPFLFATLPTKFRLGGTFQLKCVLFTQGINEKQTLANLTNESLLQRQINKESLYHVDSYINEVFKSTATPAVLRDLLDELTSTVINSPDNKKNVKILMLAEQITRSNELHATARITTCKSGKDRTSMAVTLEHCLLLKEIGAIDEQHFDELLKAMRGPNGVRVINVERNLEMGCFSKEAKGSTYQDINEWLFLLESRINSTIFQNYKANIVSGNFARVADNLQNIDVSKSNEKGDLILPGSVGKYAFNMWQWMLLPEAYRPPKSMIGGYLPT